MQPVLERGSIDKPLTFDVGLIQLSFIPVCSPNTCNIFSQIAPRVCTLVLFISVVLLNSVGNRKYIKRLQEINKFKICFYFYFYFFIFL